MNFKPFTDDDGVVDGHDGQESSSMLSTLNGGGGETLPEGEALGLDAVSDKAKLSTSTLAVGVVIVLSAAAVFGMKLTLGNPGTDDATQTAIAEIDTFITQISAAERTDAQGPITSPTAESEKVFAELKNDPTEHQVPPEEVLKNPFELVGIKRPDPDKPETETVTGPTAEQILERDLKQAKLLKVNTIMNGRVPSAFINDEMYRQGDAIGKTGFSVHAIEDTSVVIKSEASGNLIRLRYE